MPDYSFNWTTSSCAIFAGQLTRTHEGHARLMSFIKHEFISFYFSQQSLDKTAEKYRLPNLCIATGLGEGRSQNPNAKESYLIEYLAHYYSKREAGSIQIFITINKSLVRAVQLFISITKMFGPYMSILVWFGLVL